MRDGQRRRQTAGFEMVRYADDFVNFCRREAEARSALEQVESWTAQARLQLHPVKTPFDFAQGLRRIVNATQPDGKSNLAGGFIHGRTGR